MAKGAYEIKFNPILVLKPSEINLHIAIFQ